MLRQRIGLRFETLTNDTVWLILTWFDSGPVRRYGTRKVGKKVKVKPIGHF